MTNRDNNNKARNNFVEIKRLLTFPQLLGQLAAVNFSNRGEYIVGRCPLGKKPHGKNDSLSIKIETNYFRCHVCQKRGSVIDFVKFFYDMDIVAAAKRCLDIVKRIEKGELEASEDEIGGEGYTENPPAYRLELAQDDQQPAVVGIEVDDLDTLQKVATGQATTGGRWGIYKEVEPPEDKGMPKNFKAYQDKVKKEAGGSNEIMKFADASMQVMQKKLDPDDLMVINLQEFFKWR